MEMKHKNLKEDFKLPVSLGENYNGEDFRLRFTAGKFGIHYYDCSFVNGVYKNCVKVDKTHVLCLFDNHGLSCGKMSVETTICMPDTQMPDGNLRLNSREELIIMVDGKPYGLEITGGKSDVFETTDIDLSIIGTVIKGDPFLYEDFTPEQIEGLKKPAIDAANELSKKFEEDTKRLEEDYNRKTESLSSQYTDKLKSIDSIYDEKTNFLKSDFESKSAALKNDYDNKISVLSNDYASSKKGLSSDYESVKSKLNADYSAKKTALEADYEKAKELLSADYNLTKTNLELEYRDKYDALVAKYADLTSQLASDYAQKQKGLEQKIKDDITKGLNDIDAISDAPKDGKQYARKDGTWAEVQGGGGYEPPVGGIPKSDLEANVQESLNKADTALQKHQDISSKVDKVAGKGLSTEDFTTAFKTKLEGLSNYNDSAVRGLITDLQNTLDALTGKGDTTAVIDTMNEIIAFLDNFKKTDNLASVLRALETTIHTWVESKGYLTTHQSLEGKQDVISDLATIRSGASAGATAVQPSAINDMETKTHASQTYQPKGSYATESSVTELTTRLNNLVIIDEEEV